ncbi:MAG TPA: peptidase M15 [Candidatus Riflebacteria bacterium]|jgi:peptidoglycan L-alanyl-D-glutamate endopeptidase CwlK|nr:peptidase M15 [Candidatus Riflebacteria bacterium]
MASRKIEDLHPTLQPLARQFVQLCKKDGIDVLIYMTWRSNAEQDDLYALGRTKPGKKVTMLPGGRSDHNHTVNGKPASLAFDAVPQRLVDGRKVAIWNDPALWARMGEIAAEIGLSWGGTWKKFVDKPHFYLKF